MDVRAPFTLSDYVFPPGHFDARAISVALSAVATRHAEQLGIMKGFDPERDCGWVIVSMRIRILQVPEPNERVTLETWVSAIEGASLIREFRIRKSDENASMNFVDAAQSFVLFDRTTRKPVLAPLEKRKMLKGADRVFKFSTELNRKTSPADFQSKVPDHETTHVVTNDEVDHNNHLNHAEYLRWLTKHIDLKNSVGEFAIEYLREARLGDLLKIQSWKHEQSMLITFHDATSNEISAIARHS